MSTNLRIMKSDFSYDLLIIGGGISACVFASKYLQNNISKKIALIEIGRGLGGRSSTRISKRFKGWKLNHGAPNFNISNSKGNLLLKSKDSNSKICLESGDGLGFEVNYYEDVSIDTEKDLDFLLFSMPSL